MEDAVTAALIQKAHTYAAVQRDMNLTTIKQHALTSMSVLPIKEGAVTFASIRQDRIIVAVRSAIC